MDEHEESYYETDIEDLPDNAISQKVSADLSELNDTIENNIDPVVIVPGPSKINDLLKDFTIVFIVVALFTHKSVVGNIMNISVLSPFKKTMMFNLILGFIIATIYIAAKKLVEISF